MALLFTARIKCADCGATRAVSSYGDLWSGKCGCGLRLQVYVDGQTCNASCLDLFPQTGPEHDVRKRGRDPADRASRRDPSPSALRSHAKGYAILPDGWYPSHSGLRTSAALLLSRPPPPSSTRARPRARRLASATTRNAPLTWIGWLTCDLQDPPHPFRAHGTAKQPVLRHRTRVLHTREPLRSRGRADTVAMVSACKLTCEAVAALARTRGDTDPCVASDDHRGSNGARKTSCRRS